MISVGIHQPDYIPWLGLFYKMYLSDVFIHLDDAQYSNEAAHNFNTIKTSNGPLRLKFPVEQHLGDLIKDVRPKYELKWREKHLRTIEMNYAKAKYFKELFPEFRDIMMVDYPNVAALNIALNEYIAGKFGIKPQFVLASNLNFSTKREEKVIDLCVAVGGTRYISGNGARVYQEESHFTERGVELIYLDYKPITYPQLWKTFEPCMSALDFIFNCGYDFDLVIQEVKKLNEGDR
jgi:hypothetical protein